MSQKYYAPSTGGFYDTEIGGAFPADVIAISDDNWKSLVTGVNRGEVIKVIDGIPTLTAAPIVAPTKTDLIAYANRKQWSLAIGGHTVTVAGTPLTFTTDTTSMALITGKAARLNQPNPPATINWQFSTGFVSIAAADFEVAATQIADFVQATFDALSSVITAINAGTITTTAAIDAYAWPTA